MDWDWYGPREILSPRRWIVVALAMTLVAGPAWAPPPDAGGQEIEIAAPIEVPAGPIAQTQAPTEALEETETSVDSLAAGFRRALRGGVTFARIVLVAGDHEVEPIAQAIEEAEHALEPPMIVEERPSDRWLPGVLRNEWLLEFVRNKRQFLIEFGRDIARPFRLEPLHRAPLRLITEPPAALDLRRSFQNARRLYRLSEDFESRWLRELLASSATMFAITHGGEFVTGTIMGGSHLALAGADVIAGDFGGAAANLGAAAGWVGLAIPGLYDIGCWIGQGLLLVRPTRAAFNGTRKITFFVAGRAARLVGLPLLAEKIFERLSADARLRRAIETNARETTLDIEIPDNELLEFIIREPSGAPVIRMHFQPGDRDELVLERATFDPSRLAAHSYANLKGALAPFGWNVLGVFRQLRKLVLRDRADLIAEERIFVSGVETGEQTISVTFRTPAVYVAPQRWKLQPALASALRHPIRTAGRCIGSMLEALMH